MAPPYVGLAAAPTAKWISKKSPKFGAWRIVMGVSPWQSWSVSWRVLLVCQCFPGGPQGWESNRGWGELRLALIHPLFVSQSGWRDLLKCPPSLGMGNFAGCLAPEGREWAALWVLWLTLLHSSIFLGYDSVNTGGSRPTIPMQFLQCGEEKPVQDSSLFFPLTLPTANNPVDSDNSLSSVLPSNLWEGWAALLPSASTFTRHRSDFWRCLLTWLSQFFAHLWKCLSLCTSGLEWFEWVLRDGCGRARNPAPLWTGKTGFIRKLKYWFWFSCERR